MCFTFQCGATSFHDLRYTTEEYYPFSYVEKGELTGIAIEVLYLVWKELGVVPQPIDVMPWARAYRNLQLESKNVLFAVAKSKSRTPLFKWACPITSAHYVLFALKSSHIRLSDTSELRKYRIGTIRYDVGEQTLKEEFAQSKNIVSNATMKPNLELMDQDRIDLIAYDKFAIKSMLKSFNRDPEDYETVYSLAKTETCFAFNSNMDNELIERFQHALTNVIATQGFRDLQMKYFPANPK